MSDQVGFHYQRSPGPIAAADFLGKLHAIGDARRQNSATLVPVILDGENCWEYYPDGGVVVSPLVVPERRRGPARPAGDRRRLPARQPAHRHRPSPLRRKLDQPQLRDLDRSPRRQPRPGIPCTQPGNYLIRRVAVGASRSGDPANAPGTRFTSPRGRTGSGGTATTTPAPSTRSSITCSASICGTSTRCSAAIRRVICSRRFPRRRRIGRSTTSRRASCNVKVDGRSTYFEWINAAHLRLRQRARARWRWFRRVCSTRSGSASTPNGCSVRIDTEGGPARERLAESIACDRLRRSGRTGRSWSISRPLPRPVGLDQPRRRAVEQRTTRGGRRPGKILELAVPFGGSD